MNRTLFRWLSLFILLILVASVGGASAAAATPTPSGGDAPAGPTVVHIYLPLVQRNAGPPPDEMVSIPAGSFPMGCDPAHNGGFVCGVDELPLHTVTLDAYQIAKYEVTNAAYAQCVAAKICKAPYSNASFTRTSYYGNSTYDNYPVIYVDWNQSNTYCAWKGNRLPSEAEWEKAARGATIQAYPWGDFSATCGLANFWLGTSGCVGDTSAVGSYPAGASTYGALDMLGNVWEWVNDWYAGTYYDDPAAGTNPTGPATGYNKVRRGGDFASTGFYLRDATRGIYPPIYFDRFGFRCAR